MVTGATTFVVMSALKVATLLGVGLGMTTGLQYFYNFKFKPRSKKEKGVESDVSEGKSSLKERARSFS
jgi:hypothetical protein